MNKRMDGLARRCWWLGGLWLVAMLLLLAGGCAPENNIGTQKGNIAPDFSLATLDGGAENLRDYRGRTVILNFWASWCGPCRAEMPDLQAVYGELRGNNLVVLGVNQGEPREQVAAFAREFGLSFPILLDSNQEVGAKYGVRAYPTTFIIDSQGVIRDVVVGGPLTRTAVRRMVGGLLK